jgi:hypothetical protein
MVYSPAIRACLRRWTTGAASPIATISARPQISGSASSFAATSGPNARGIARQQTNSRLHSSIMVTACFAATPFSTWSPPRCWPRNSRTTHRSPSKATASLINGKPPTDIHN